MIFKPYRKFSNLDRQFKQVATELETPAQVSLAGFLNPIRSIITHTALLRP